MDATPNRLGRVTQILREFDVSRNAICLRLDISRQTLFRALKPTAETPPVKRHTRDAIRTEIERCLRQRGWKGSSAWLWEEVPSMLPAPEAVAALEAAA